jgi:hypothetical protein
MRGSQTFPPPVLTGSGSTGQLAQSQPWKWPPEVSLHVSPNWERGKAKALERVLYGR